MFMFYGHGYHRYLHVLPHSVHTRRSSDLAEGEVRVRGAFPAATIIRPSVGFGPEDDFINRLARMVKLMPIVPVVKPDVRFQPIWVTDVARDRKSTRLNSSH